MFSFIDFARRFCTTFSSRAFLPLQEILAEQKPKMQELNAILKKYTSEVQNHLRGATFVAVNDKGSFSITSSFLGEAADTRQEKHFTPSPSASVPLTLQKRSPFKQIHYSG
jgi:hypothetical protein